MGFLGCLGSRVSRLRVSGFVSQFAVSAAERPNSPPTCELLTREGGTHQGRKEENFELNIQVSGLGWLYK